MPRKKENRTTYNTTIRLPHDILNGLDIIKERVGVTHSEQVRRALIDWLLKNGVMLPPAPARKRTRGAA